MGSAGGDLTSYVITQVQNLLFYICQEQIGSFERTTDFFNMMIVVESKSLQELGHIT